VGPDRSHWSHGAHVHLDDNAVGRLLQALAGLQRLRDLPVDAPVAVRCAIERSRPLSEPLGGSGARWFRMARLPTVVYGPTPHGMGGPDEWVDIVELDQVARVHALTAFDMLTEGHT